MEDTKDEQPPLALTGLLGRLFPKRSGYYWFRYRCESEEVFDEWRPCEVRMTWQKPCDETERSRSRRVDGLVLRKTARVLSSYGVWDVTANVIVKKRLIVEFSDMCLP